MKRLAVFFLLLSVSCFSAEDYLDANGNLNHKKLGFKFFKPAGDYNFSKIPVFFKIPGALVEYFNAEKRISFLIVSLNHEGALGLSGKILRFRLSGIASNIEVVEDNVWLLKKNAITLFQLYKCYVKDMLFYISAYIMKKKNAKNQKSAF